MTECGSSTGAARDQVGADHARSLLAAVAAATNTAIVAKDLEGRVTFWNAAATSLFGFTTAEMIGAPVMRIIPAERIAEETFILAEIRRGAVVSHFETERLTKDGRTIPVAITVSPMRDDTGEIVGASKIATGLSEIHRTRDELQRREALLLSILDTVPDGLIVIDDRGLVQSVSPAAERMFGSASAELVGSNINRLMPPSDATDQDSYIERYPSTGQRHIFAIGRTVVARRKDGSTFPVELQMGEVRLPTAHLFTVFVRDLTEMRNRERRFADLQAELLHVSRVAELGQMVSMLAHEVSQPLTAIANYALGLRRLVPVDGPASLAVAIEKIAAQAERARSIVQSLRDLVRKEPRPRQVERLETVIREAATLALAGNERAVSFSLRIAPDAAWAFIDKVQIQQLLLNLMRNSVEALEGAVARRLDLLTTRNGDRIELRVSDSGPGLPAAVRARLFQPFVTTKAEGLGVGLSICRTIAQGHGGDLVLEDRQDGRTTFCFTVPSAGEEATLAAL